MLKSVEKERRKKGGKVTRQFIVTEGLFEKDGQISDLPKLVTAYLYSLRSAAQCHADRAEEKVQVPSHS